MRRELVPTVDAAGREMSPTAVTGDREIGIGRARDVGDIVRNGTESVLFEGEMRGAPVDNPAADHAAALAHGRGSAELGKVGHGVALRGSSGTRAGAGRHRRHSCRLRPIVPAWSPRGRSPAK